ncbi:MAG: LuxR C-terminal-related transcriptional regulator [Solirubrobacteraceae bacterium]|nr:LuxR C-terminal-related transcriptional regulator [Solirubrobacteraceae bacterium]
MTTATVSSALDPAPDLPEPAIDGPGSAAWAVRAATALVTTPIDGLLEAFGELVDEVLPGRNRRPLALLTGDCPRAPMKVRGGAEHLPGVVSSVELAVLAGETPHGTASVRAADIAGAERRVIVANTPPAGSAGALFVVDLEHQPADPDPLQLEAIRQLCTLTAAAYQGRATSAEPSPASGNLAIAQTRARAIVELAEAHEVTLSALLATLRARDLSDAAARTVATEAAANALVELRTASLRDRELSEEPADEAFERLREQLRPLTRHAAATLELSGPGTARLLPAELANAARSISRGVVLALLEQQGVGRVRIDWTADASGLVLRARDDGPGTFTQEALAGHRTVERAEVLGGSVTVDAVDGWGTTVTVSVPLVQFDLPAPSPLDALNAREREVLAELARGARNRDIGETLTITSHTVKFHVANILRKTGTRTRGEVAALAREHGVAAG